MAFTMVSGPLVDSKSSTQGWEFCGYLLIYLLYFFFFFFFFGGGGGAGRGQHAGL